MMQVSRTTPAVQAKTREDAWALLTKFTESESLRKHALAVEAAMRWYARKLGEDEETWGMVGLLHDFDYEQYPSLEEHPYRGQEILAERGWPEDIRRAIMAHAPHTGTERNTPMEKAIFAVDELAGFITAVALVRPGKQLAEVNVRSVKKKLKQKTFASGVSREEVLLGAEELGISLDDHIANVLEALQEIAPDLGL